MHAVDDVGTANYSKYNAILYNTYIEMYIILPENV